MLTALPIAVTIGLLASRLGGITRTVLITALTLASAYFGAISGDGDAVQAFGAALLAMVTMQGGYVAGLLITAWRQPALSSRAN